MGSCTSTIATTPADAGGVCVVVVTPPTAHPVLDAAAANEMQTRTESPLMSSLVGLSACENTTPLRRVSIRRRPQLVASSFVSSVSDGRDMSPASNSAGSPPTSPARTGVSLTRGGAGNASNAQSAAADVHRSWRWDSTIASNSKDASAVSSVSNQASVPHRSPTIRWVEACSINGTPLKTAVVEQHGSISQLEWQHSPQVVFVPVLAPRDTTSAVSNQSATRCQHPSNSSSDAGLLPVFGIVITSEMMTDSTSTDGSDSNTPLSSHHRGLN